MTRLTKEQRAALLKELVESEGFAGVDELLEAAVTDACCPAICTTTDCGYIDEMEPDQEEGYCEECESNTMVSCLILAEVI